MNIDMHSHFVPQAQLEDLTTQRDFPSVKVTVEKGGGSGFVRGHSRADLGADVASRNAK